MYYRARYYMPEIGRFIEEDPHPGFLREPLSLNSKYIYVENSPLKNIDPYGLFANMAAFENTVNRFFKDVSREATRFWKVNRADIVSTVVVASAIGLTIASGGASSSLLVAAGAGGGVNMLVNGASFSNFIQGAAVGTLMFGAAALGGAAGSFATEAGVGSLGSAGISFGVGALTSTLSNEIFTLAATGSSPSGSSRFTSVLGGGFGGVVNYGVGISSSGAASQGGSAGAGHKPWWREENIWR